MSDQRTIQQNKALHKGFELLAEALNDGGWEIKSVMAVKEIDIPWTEKTIKELLYRPVMVAMLNKHSTTELDTKEISDVWDVLTRHLGQHFGVAIEFPSDEAPLI